MTNLATWFHAVSGAESAAPEPEPTLTFTQFPNAAFRVDPRGTSSVYTQWPNRNHGATSITPSTPQFQAPGQRGNFVLEFLGILKSGAGARLQMRGDTFPTNLVTRGWYFDWGIPDFIIPLSDARYSVSNFLATYDWVFSPALTTVWQGRLTYNVRVGSGVLS